LPAYYWNTVKTLLRLALPAVLLIYASCSRPEKPAPAAPARRYALKGIIESVDATRPAVTVVHESVPGFMDAMTMSFPVHDDPQVIAILRAGDKIEATLVLDGDRYWLEKIVTKGFVPTPAPGVASASRPAGAVTPAPNRAVGVGDLFPDFALTDQTGRIVRLSQFRGEPVAVTFLYTRCPIVTACPLTTAKFSKLDAMLVDKKFGELLTVTVDPEHDTPEVLADYAKKAGADPKRWKFLTGDPKAVAEVASRFGILYYPDHGQIVHGQGVAVIDPKGRVATAYFGNDWQPEHILRDLEAARKAPS
jgi:protein SCO1/2